MTRFRQVLGCAVISFVLFLNLFLFGSPKSWASEVRYVSDQLVVNVRAIPSYDGTKLFQVSTGDTLTLLQEPSEGWAKVRTADGKEGWMHVNYLTEEKPARLLLKEQDPKNNDMVQKLETLTAENEKMRQELEEARKQTSTNTQQYAQLKSEAAEYMALKEDHQKLKEEFELQGQKLDELSAESDSLRFGNNLKWFLAGAGVLLLGWILGLSFGKRKKRWSSGLH